MTKQNEFIMRFTTKFKGSRIIDNEVHPTSWKLTTDLVTEPNSTDNEFNFGINKVKFWFEQLVDGGLFFSANNKWAMTAFINKAANVPILCPKEPGDDHLTLLFYSKINALANGAFTAGFTELESDTAGGLSFMYVGEDDPILPTMKEWIGKRSYFDKPWWHRDDGSTLDITPKRGADLSDIPDFVFDLNFLNEQKEDKEAKVIRPKFQPKVIDGKKKD